MIQDALTRYLRANLHYTEHLVRDLTPQQMTAQPKTQYGTIVNHPTWLLGHLATSIWPMPELLGDRDLAAQWLDWFEKESEGVGEQEGRYPTGSELPERWMRWFDTGSKPLAGKEVEQYPSKDELLESLRRSHQRLIEWVEQANVAQLAAEMPIKEAREQAPTIGHAVVLIAIHEAQHLGQLATWRRAMGLAPKA